MHALVGEDLKSLSGSKSVDGFGEDFRKIGIAIGRIKGHDHTMLALKLSHVEGALPKRDEVLKRSFDLGSTLLSTRTGDCKDAPQLARVG